MTLEAFQKEQQLQIHLVEKALADFEAAIDGDGNYDKLASYCARIANEKLFQFRFGGFRGDMTSAVYANMGSHNFWVIEGLRKELWEEDIRELVTATWPRPENGDPYTFAMIIEDPDTDYWFEIMREVWCRGG